MGSPSPQTTPAPPHNPSTPSAGRRTSPSLPLAPAPERTPATTSETHTTKRPEWSMGRGCLPAGRRKQPEERDREAVRVLTPERARSLDSRTAAAARARGRCRERGCHRPRPRRRAGRRRAACRRCRWVAGDRRHSSPPALVRAQRCRSSGGSGCTAGSCRLPAEKTALPPP